MDNKFRYNKKDNVLVQLHNLPGSIEYYKNCISVVPPGFTWWHDSIQREYLTHALSRKTYPCINDFDAQDGKDYLKGYHFALCDLTNSVIVQCDGCGIYGSLFKVHVKELEGEEPVCRRCICCGDGIIKWDKRYSEKLFEHIIAYPIRLPEKEPFDQWTQIAVYMNQFKEDKIELAAFINTLKLYGFNYVRNTITTTKS